MIQDRNYTFVKTLRGVLTATMMLLTSVTAMADGVVVGGSVFGGGNQADVKINTEVNIKTGQVKGNVYGGGNEGDVGTIVKRADYNYKWTNSDPSTIDLDDSSTYPYNNTGVCSVTITGGTIGAEGKATADHASGAG